MIAMPRPRDTIESTAPSSSASTVARGIQSWAAHQSRVYEVQFSARSTFDIVEKSLRLEGVLVRNHPDAQAELDALVVPRLRSGLVAPDVTVVDGFERTVDGFLGMLRGENTGKMPIRIADWDPPRPSQQVAVPPVELERLAGRGQGASGRGADVGGALLLGQRDGAGRAEGGEAARPHLPAA